MPAKHGRRAAETARDFVFGLGAAVWLVLRRPASDKSLESLSPTSTAMIMPEVELAAAESTFPVK